MQLTALLLPLLMFQGGGKLVIEDTKICSCETVQVGDRVTVHYTGKLTDGKTFDSSVGKDPFTFIVGAGQVIKGWDQGLPGMKTGGKRVLTIPPSLAYGANEHGPIPANSTLKFDVELVKVERVGIEVLQKGKGEPTTGGDKVQVHYTGTFAADGKKFDSSRDRNEPFEVTIGRTGLIPGFTMGLLGMLPGEKRRVTIPAELGYGAKGAGTVIPPNSKLVFEIELLKVVK